MRRSNSFDHQPWFLIAVKPSLVTSFRRWNRVVIWSLAFVVAGVFAMTLTPQPGHATFAEGPVRVGGRMQAPRLVRRVNPIYPQLAKATRTQGAVVLDCIIDEQGNVTQIRLISGHPLLVQAALAAVQQWKYQRTLLNGNPVSVEMRVTVSVVLGTD